MHSGWTAKDGAPSAIQALAQTRDGLLWLGTAAGLYQFDGVTFQRYAPPSWTRLPAHISCLMSLPNGGLWVGFEYGAVSFLQNGTVTNFGIDQGFPPARVSGFAQDHESGVWVATSRGLAHLEGDHWKMVGPEWNFYGSMANAVLVDHRGILWVATESTVEFLLPGTSRFQSTGDVIRQVFQIAESPDGRPWIADLTGSVRPVALSVGPKRSSINLLIESPKILFARDGTLWITSAENGLRRAVTLSGLNGDISQSSGNLEAFTRSDGLTDDRTNAILQDREGDIWVGTRNGLDRFVPANVISVPLPFDSAAPVIAAAENGDMWIARGSTGDVFRDHVGHLTFVGKLGQVFGSYRGSDGTVWWLGPAGITKFRNGSNSRIALQKGAPPPLLASRIATSHPNALWMAERSRAVFRQTEGVWTKSAEPAHLESLTPSAAYTDSDERVWFGYEGGTIATFRGVNLERIYSPQQSSIGTVKAISGAKGHIWLGGEFGLALFNNGYFHPVIPDDAARFGIVEGVVETEKGDLWLAESRGIVHVNSEGIQRFLGNTAAHVHGYVFDSLDGLPGAFRDDQTFPTEVQGTDGRIWFVTTDGVAWIDPENIRRNALPPPVLIRAVSANKKQYDPWPPLVFPALTKNLQIEYAGMSLSVPERVRFRYKLEGFDKEWQNAGTRRDAIYSSLPPGSYRFRVIACNNDGIWNTEGASIAFTIVPAWYQTHLFLAGCIVAGLLMIRLAYAIRVRQLANQHKVRFDELVAERTRIARELHDTLVQTIQGSKMVVEDGLKAAADPSRMQRALERSSRFLEQATQEARAALNSLRISTTEANDLADAVQRALEDCKRHSAIAVSFSATGQSREMHPVVRDEIYRIGYEAIRNACLHSHASRLEVELVYSRDITLRVTDNGVGIDPVTASKGRDGHYGLQGMRERADRIAGKLTVISSTGAGTEITIVVPGKVVFSSEVR